MSLKKEKKNKSVQVCDHSISNKNEALLIRIKKS